ncbi:MAG TPA: sodium:glutamate symporter [Clostridiaceae bacterium]|nr:sodium:glutamate symporter [Clostridiaceae bacterium]
MNYSAANTELWNFVLQISILAGIMLLANVLCRKVRFFQKSMVPTAVLAGFITLILKSIGLLPVDAEFLEIITYHTIGIGFIALSLRIPNNRQKSSAKGDLAALKSGALIVSTYLLQGIVGLIISITLAYTIYPDFFKAAGILLPMGYGQGPGQANNVGSTYEQLGFAGGQSFGLSIAAAGFLCACVVGVVYLNYLKRNKKVEIKEYVYVSGSVTVDDFQDSNEIPISESVDRLSVQVALVLLVYLGTYLLSLGVTSFLEKYSPGLADVISPLIWGFNFIIGSLLAIVCRIAFNGLTKMKLMTRQYPNNYLLSRISGCAFDFMTIAGIAAIEFKDLRGQWIPFILMAVIGGVVTFVYLKWICSKIYPNYEHEGMISMFGMLTGTISSGVLLLREIDSSFKTPAANNLLTGSSFAIILGAPMLVLIGLAPKSDTMLFITFGLMIIYFIPLLFIMLKAKRKKRKRS